MDDDIWEDFDNVPEYPKYVEVVTDEGKFFTVGVRPATTPRELVELDPDDDDLCAPRGKIFDH